MPEAQIIVDTGPLVAFLIREEAHHLWVVGQFQRLHAPFLTCEPGTDGNILSLARHPERAGEGFCAA